MKITNGDVVFWVMCGVVGFALGINPDLAMWWW